MFVRVSHMIYDPLLLLMNTFGWLVVLVFFYYYFALSLSFSHFNVWRHFACISTHIRRVDSIYSFASLNARSRASPLFFVLYTAVVDLEIYIHSFDEAHYLLTRSNVVDCVVVVEREHLFAAQRTRHGCKWMINAFVLYY